MQLLQYKLTFILKKFSENSQYDLLYFVYFENYSNIYVILIQYLSHDDSGVCRNKKKLTRSVVMSFPDFSRRTLWSIARIPTYDPGADVSTRMLTSSPASTLSRWLLIVT